MITGVAVHIHVQLDLPPRVAERAGRHGLGRSRCCTTPPLNQRTQGREAHRHSTSEFGP